MLRTLKVATTDLDIGMFVSALDRPWLGTPFATQGFYIKSPADIERLRKFCEFVMVDSRRSIKREFKPTRNSAPYTREKSDDKTIPLDRQRVPVEHIFLGTTIRPYLDEGRFEDEQPRAEQAFDILVEDIDRIFDGVQSGERLDVVQLRKSVEPIVDSISRNPDACLWVARLKQHDRYTYRHSLSASVWAVSLGRQLGLPKRDLRTLSMGCMLMDIGKLRIAPELLQAERELSNDEMAELASHVQHGLDILNESGILNKDVYNIVAHHHERFDGSGYPQGLRGDQIPPFARVAAIVDTYDAITSVRSYAQAIAPADAIRVLYGARDEEFQAELVEAFIQAIGIYPAGTLVELSTGEVGVVVAEYRTRRLRPKVMLLLDANKRRIPEAKIVDLHAAGDDGDAAVVTIRRSLEPDAFGIDLSQLAT